MSEYHAHVTWSRGTHEFAKQRYSRGHSWSFDEGLTVPASASAHVVRGPWTVGKAVDPEEAFVAALSSCHMLVFLSLVSRDGFIVESYEDKASGVMAKNAAGKEAMTSATLRPVVTFSGTVPTQAQLDGWHHEAHEDCYIANSVTTEVRIEGSLRSI
jgi:organic hydroperoxide reductase OsmC/OhrA